jgi:tetratricopeptide (TPR) repeat protein
MYPDARKEFDKIYDVNFNDGIDYWPVMQSYGYALMGDKIKGRELLEKAIRKPGKDKLSPYRLSQVYVALGNYQQALDELDRSYQIRDLHLFWVGADPAFNPIRNQPRFNDLLKKMNLL